MEILITEIYKRIDLCLDRDIFGLDENKKGSSKKQQREFVKYLVSVATHPIGLRASVKPYNCSQEDMLLYLMDMFDLTGTKLRAITIGKNKSKFKRTNGKLDIQPVKRHSWRPELKIRLHPPTFFYKERLFLENLYVRVFLITEDRSHLVKPNNDLSNVQDAKVKGMLNKIFKKAHTASSNRIRAMNELSQVVKFIRDENSSLKHSSSRKSSRPDYKMTQLIKEQGEVKDDIHLNIRRYYCEPQYSYMLRFEFWLNSDVLHLSCFRRYKRFMRRIIPGNFSRCSKASNQFTNLFGNQEFYGFINIKLANLPSYAMKQTYPILSLQERRVNNCEISIELKNRRILEDNTEKGSQLVNSNISSNLMTKKSNESFLINHVRLYSNCILYQCLSLAPSNHHTLTEAGKFRNITLDNLLYLPGHTLINQHRLQSNLSHFEDQCIRRVSIIILLIKLEIKKIDDNEKIIDYVKTLLISLLQNEYATAHRLVDDKTLQEVDPFRTRVTSATENFISGLELLSLKNFLNMFLIPRSDKWLLKLDDDSTSSIIHRSMTLSGLKLFKTALVQLKRRDKGSQQHADPQTIDIFALKHSIEQHLCKIIIEHIRMRLETIVHTDPTKSGKVGGTRRNKPLSSTIEDDNIWLQLLHDIRYIQHDLTLYWSRKGLNSLVEHEQPFVKKLGLFENLEKMNLSSIIETKLENYLRHKDRIIT